MALGFLPLPIGERIYEVTAGSITVAGAAPTVTAGKVLRVRAGLIRITGYQVTVDTGQLSWPRQLPAPRIETHAFQPRAQLSRADMEQGAARQRRVSTLTPAEVPFSFVVDALQMAILEAWFDFRADYGGQWFRIDLLSSTGLAEHTVRLMGEFEYKEITPQRWMVTGTFEVIERPMLTEAELDALIGAES